MTNEFKKIQKDKETRYILETATGGASSTAGGSTVSHNLGQTQRRSASEATPTVPQKPRQGHLRPQTGGGKHRDKKKEQKSGQEKHRKPFAENDVEESGLQYHTGVKKHGEKYMKMAAAAGRRGASQAELGRLRDKYSKAYKEDSVAEGYQTNPGQADYYINDINADPDQMAFGPFANYKDAETFMYNLEPKRGVEYSIIDGDVGIYGHVAHSKNLPAGTEFDPKNPPSYINMQQGVAEERLNEFAPNRGGDDGGDSLELPLNFKGTNVLVWPKNKKYSMGDTATPFPRGERFTGKVKIKWGGPKIEAIFYLDPKDREDREAEYERVYGPQGRGYEDWLDHKWYDTTNQDIQYRFVTDWRLIPAKEPGGWPRIVDAIGQDMIDEVMTTPQNFINEIIHRDGDGRHFVEPRQSLTEGFADIVADSFEKGDKVEYHQGIWTVLDKDPAQDTLTIARDIETVDALKVSKVHNSVDEAGYYRGYERDQQRQMDAEKRRFKQAELGQELGHEDDPNFQRQLIDRDRGPWYLKINGKILRSKGELKVFDWKRGANNYALAIIKNKPELEDKIFLVRKPEDDQPDSNMKETVDHEISMASNELTSIIEDAMRLLKIIRQYSEMEGLEAWQQSKITKAADYLNAVLNNLQGDEVFSKEDHSNFNNGYGQESYNTYANGNHGRGVAEELENIDPYFEQLKQMLESEINEEAPPEAKFKRMAKHIKAGYKGSGLDKKEIAQRAFGATWKAKKRADNKAKK
jgi:hypothetical protein